MQESPLNSQRFSWLSAMNLILISVWMLFVGSSVPSSAMRSVACVGKVILHGAATENHGVSSTLPILYTEFTAATASSHVGVSLQYPQNHILESS